MPPGRAGRASAASSRRPSIWPTRRTRASWSPRCPRTPSRPAPSTSACTAGGATPRTRSRSSNRISSPTGRRPPASPPTSSGSSSPPSHRSSSPSSGKRFTAPGWRGPPPERSGSSFSGSAPASWCRCAASRSPWTPHTPPPRPSHASTRDYQGSLRGRPLPTVSAPPLMGPVRPGTLRSVLRPPVRPPEATKPLVAGPVFPCFPALNAVDPAATASTPSSDPFRGPPLAGVRNAG